MNMQTPEDGSNFATEADAALAELGGPPIDMIDARARLRRGAWVYKKIRADLDTAEADIETLRQELSLAVTSRDQWKANAEQALDNLDAAEERFILWLVETLHYPYDVKSDPPPPVDHRALARYWNSWDKWGLSEDEAYASICEEAGIES